MLGDEAADAAAQDGTRAQGEGEGEPEAASSLDADAADAEDEASVEGELDGDPSVSLPQVPADRREAGEDGLAEEEWDEDVESSYLQSKYTLVSVAAKRARQILDGSAARVETLSEKPVTVALEELSQGKLYFERVREAR